MVLKPSEKPPEDKKRSFVLRDRDSSHLTILHTALIMAGIVFMLVAIYVFRPYIPLAVSNFIKQQIFSSEIVFFVNQSLKEISGPKGETVIPEFGLTISPKYMREIHAQTQRLAIKGFMEKNDQLWVPAIFFSGKEQYKVKARVRGELPNHWEKSKKSWRIKFKKGNLFNGYKQINIVIPEDKTFFVGDISHFLARKMGLIAPDSGFARVSINSVNMGLYWWFEQLRPATIERLAYPEGSLLTGRVEPGLYARMGISPLDLDEHSGSYEVVFGDNPVKAVAIDRWQKLMAIIRRARNEKSDFKEIGSLVNIERFAKWHAITALFGDRHSQYRYNTRWYYNSTTGLFEPIFLDVSVNGMGAWVSSAVREHGAIGSFDQVKRDSYFSNVVRQILRVRPIMDRRNYYLWEMLVSNDFYVAELFHKKWERYRYILAQGPNQLSFAEIEKQLTDTESILRQNSVTLRRFLTFSELLVESRIEPAGEGTRFIVDLTANTLSTLSLQSIAIVANKQKTIRGAKTFLVIEGRERQIIPAKYSIGTSGVMVNFPNPPLLGVKMDDTVQNAQSTIFTGLTNIQSSGPLKITDSKTPVS